MNQKQLERKVKYWQKILKLDHWDITCELVHTGDIDGRIGKSYPQPEYLCSHLKIMDPQFDKKKECNTDRHIIHELNHCHTAMWSDKTKNKFKEEEELVVTTFEIVIYDLHKEIYE